MSQKMSNALKQGDNTPVILKSNSELEIDVRILENEDGSISINAEDTAIGFGWIQIQTKNGKEYKSVRWERMNDFSKECGFPHIWGKDDYIPESLFYRLGMKASNERAQKFQGWLADEVIPEIRKNGSYILSGLSEEMKVLLSHDKKLVQVENRINTLENNMFITRGQKKKIRNFISDVVKNTCGSKYSNAYKELKNKVYAEVYSKLYNYFEITSYEEIPRNKYQDALNIINSFKPSRELELMIKGANHETSNE